jgi:ketosteroid isomerase-like protein
VERADFDTYIARFNAEDPGAFATYMAPDVRMLNGTLVLRGVAEVTAHYARIWAAMRESLHVERFVSDAGTVAIQMHTHFEVRADDASSPFGRIRAGETFDYHGLIMYRLAREGTFADVKVAYLSFIYTDLRGSATDLGIPH